MEELLKAAINNPATLLTNQVAIWKAYYDMAFELERLRSDNTWLQARNEYLNTVVQNHEQENY